jgi:WD40 repeat protein
MTTDPAQLADSQHPWIGLASFTESDREFFAGRGEEIDELLRLVRRDILTLLYGVSGLGKTSLLQAGLFPALRAEDCLPVPIRLDYLEGAAPLSAQVLGAIIAAADAARVEAPQPRPDETLWEYLHREGNHFWSPHNDLVTPFLAFDQFEELFTLGRETRECVARTTAFISELADLVENRPPAALRDDPLGAKEFSFKPAPLKVLLVMREDYLADLDRIRSHFRALGQNRQRLLPMGERQARQVIALGAPLLAPRVEDRILKFVAGGDDDDAEITIAPALLSLVLRELNERRLALGPDAKITPDLLDVEQQKIFEEFYLRTIQNFPVGVRTFIEDKLLTTTGYRDSCALDDALSCRDVTQPVLNELVNRRLLAYEDRHNTRRVELTHDVLIPVIKASRDARLTREALAQAEQQQREAYEKARVARRRLAVVAVLLVLAVAGAIYGWVQTKQAEEQAKNASYYKQFTVLRPLYAAWTPGSADRNILFACQMANDFAGKKNTIDPLLYGDVISLLYRALERRKRLVETYWNYEWPESREIVGDRYPVFAVAYAPDDQTLVTGDSRGRIRVLRGGVLGDLIPVRGGSIRSLAFSPDSSRVAIGTYDGFVSLFDLRDSARPQTIVQLLYPDDANKEHMVWSCSWNAKGDLAAACQDGSVYVWSDLLSKTQFENLQPPVRLENRVNDKLIQVHAVAWDSTSSMLAIGDGDGNLRIWNRSVLSEPTKAHAEAIWSVAWSQDGRLACASWDRSISVWNIETSAQSVVPSLLKCHREAHNQRIRDLAWIDNDQMIASVGDDGMLKFWKTSDLSDLGFSEQSPKPEIWRLSYRADKKEIATANDDGSVRIYRVYPPPQEAHGNHLNDVICLAFAESKVLSFDSDGLLNIFDSEEKPVQIPVDFQSGIRCARFQPKINAFVIGYAHSACSPSCGQLVVWDPRQPAAIKSCGLGEKVYYVDCHPKEPIVAFLTSVGTLGLRTLPDLQPVARQPDLQVMQQSDRRVVRRLAWSNAGDRLLVALNHEDDNNSEILRFQFDVKGLNGLTSIHLPFVISSVAWHPRDDVVAIGTMGGAIILQSLLGGQTKPVVGHDGPVNALSWSPDGRQLYTGGEDGGVKVWDFDPEGKNQLMLGGSLRQDTGGIRVIGVDPEGRGCYIGGTDPRIFYWPKERYSAARILERAEKMVHRNMFTTEWARYVAEGDRLYERTFKDLPELHESQ